MRYDSDDFIDKDMVRRNLGIPYVDKVLDDDSYDGVEL